MPNLARITATPVKGTALQEFDRASLTEAGIPGNRRFFFVDVEGRLVSGSVHGTLVQIATEYDPATDQLRLRLPGDVEVVGKAGDLGDGLVTDFYGRPVAGHRVDGPFDEAVSSFVGHPVRLVAADAAGDGLDVHRLTIVSRASVDELAQRGGYDGHLNADRFRINLEFGGCEPFEEDTWGGCRITVGSAVLQVLDQIPRCIVTTQDPATGVKDWDTLRHIASFRELIPSPRGIPFGMYAEVETPGEIAVGDPVSLL